MGYSGEEGEQLTMGAEQVLGVKVSGWVGEGGAEGWVIWFAWDQQFNIAASVIK